MQRIQRPLLLGLLMVAAIVANLLVLEDLADIRTAPHASDVGPANDANDDRPVVKVGVVSRFAPSVIYRGYQPIMEHLSRKGSFRYELELSTSYQDAVDRLRDGRVQVSFLGAWIFSHVPSADNLVPILAPLNADGRSEFHAVLIARPDRGLRSIADLRGLRVALPSPQSYSGNWLQSRGLEEAGLTPADLDTIQHFAHHPTVVWQVLRGDFDAGVVKESVAASYADEGLARIAVSRAIPGPPLVGRRDADPRILDEIRSLLLDLDPQDPRDRVVLDSWTPEFSHGFTAVEMEDYRHAFDREGVR